RFLVRFDHCLAHHPRAKSYGSKCVGGRGVVGVRQPERMARDTWPVVRRSTDPRRKRAGDVSPACGEQQRYGPQGKRPREKLDGSKRPSQDEPRESWSWAKRPC